MGHEGWVPGDGASWGREAVVSGELGERYLLVQVQLVIFIVSEVGLL